MWTGKGATGVPAAPDSRDLSRTEEISLQAFSARPLPTYAAYSTPMWTRPYTENILRFGPSHTFWTLKFESKHSYKNLVRRTKNFKNMSFSLCSHHQNLQQILYLSHFEESLIDFVVYRLELEFNSEHITLQL